MPHLRDVRAEDLPILFEHQRDADAARIAAFPPRDRDAFMAHWTTRVLGNASAKNKAVVVDGRVAGYVVGFDRGGRRWVGYWFGKEYWGKGVATAALQAFLLCDTSRPLFAAVAVSNVGSIRVLEKCGFAVAPAGVAEPGPPDDGVQEVVLVLDR